MANKLVLKAKKIFLGGLNISAESNRIELSATIEEPESTNFASLAKEAEPGLEVSMATIGVMLPTEFDLEAALFAGRGSAQIATFFIEGNDLGDVAYSVYGLSTKHYPGAQVGQLLGTTVELVSRGVPTIRGQVLEAEASYVHTDAAGAGELEIAGGVASGQQLTLVVHLLELTGITALGVELESDADDTFASAVTRITLASFTANGAQRGVVAGPITDEWFRLALAATGTGSYKLAAILSVAAA